MKALDAAVHDLREVVRDLRSELAVLRGSSPHPPVDGRTLMGPADVARMLGVSTRTLRRLRKSRRFPRPIRGSGRRPRWTRASIRRFMEGS
jgi:predicted DNA-binding transcriptional regulator AlpA